MADYRRYEEQFNALMDVLNFLRERYSVIQEADPQKPDGSMPGAQTILPKHKAIIMELLEGLEKFARGQFEFFYTGFNPNAKSGLVLKAQTAPGGEVQFPPEHVLSNIIEQVSRDLTIIQLAAEQRIWLPVAPQEAVDSKNTRPEDKRTIQELLAEADGLAWSALWPRQTKEARTWEPKAVLTYLTDSIRVRVMPYAHIVLVAIPYMCLQDRRMLLAIPHEIGHFRYWYSYEQTETNLTLLSGIRVQDWKRQDKPYFNLREMFYVFEYEPQTLSQTPKGLTKPIPNWAEEIFADVYGVLVGGPLAILTAMDLALEGRAKDFGNFNLEDTHPTPLLRPILMVKALLALNQTTQHGLKTKMLKANQTSALTVSIQLLNRWKEKLIERGVLSASRQDNDTAQLFEFVFQAHEGAERIEFLFRDETTRDRMTEWVGTDWTTLDAAEFPAENLVKVAIEALRYAYIDLDARYAGWGWSSLHTEESEPKKTGLAELGMNELYAQAGDLLEALIAAAKGSAPLDLEDPSPNLWNDWVTTKKKYFKELPTGELYAGEFETTMDPKNRPGKNWLPVFGAGGWDTRGPCGSPGHP